MTEELVTLETAKLLKEKGFNERKYLIDVSTWNHCHGNGLPIILQK